MNNNINILLTFKLHCHSNVLWTSKILFVTYFFHFLFLPIFFGPYLWFLMANAASAYFIFMVFSFSLWSSSLIFLHLHLSGLKSVYSSSWHFLKFPMLLYFYTIPSLSNLTLDSSFRFVSFILCDFPWHISNIDLYLVLVLVSVSFGNPHPLKLSFCFDAYIIGWSI